jgi:L-seryl-tRNA(Ser) seleniumtransferase
MNAAGLKRQCKAMIDWSKIPSVEKLLQTDEYSSLFGIYGRPLVVNCIREELDEIRLKIQAGEKFPRENVIAGNVKKKLEAVISFSIKPVINASGVILHTNLGRAPLSKDAIEAMVDGVSGYSSLEYDLVEGKRSQRTVHVEAILKRFLGVESALVVNNNASAVLLVLNALARKKRVIISRGQLVEIGGGFRVPDVLKQSGAKLVEIGTTNRVHLSDYQSALKEPAGLVLRVHSSNFKVIGFTSEPELKEIVDISHAAGVPVVDDLGSGAVLDTTQFGLIREPTVQESLYAGVDVVCFSGDKLIGGPQAGIIVGKKAYLDQIKKFPLMRAIRADKTLLLALEATLIHYLKDEALEKIPVWQMIAQPEEAIKTRAVKWRDWLGFGEVIESRSTIGGGSLPEETLPTFVLALVIDNPDKLAAALRKTNPAIVGRIQSDRILFDPRTVFLAQDELFLSTLSKTIKDYREKNEN